MSTSAIVINLVFVAILCLAAVLTLGLCRAAGRVSEAERTRPRRVWDFATQRWVDLPAGVDPGPEQMTRQQIEEADSLELSWLTPAHGETAAVTVDDGLTGLFERHGPPPADPVWEAGRERLWDAFRDEQTGEAS